MKNKRIISSKRTHKYFGPSIVYVRGKKGKELIEYLRNQPKTDTTKLKKEVDQYTKQVLKRREEKESTNKSFMEWAKEFPKPDIAERERIVEGYIQENLKRRERLTPSEKSENKQLVKRKDNNIKSNNK